MRREGNMEERKSEGRKEKRKEGRTKEEGGKSRRD
jgi:hypothetical protein